MVDANGTEQQATAAPSAIEAIRTRIADLEKRLNEMGARREFNRNARAEAGPPINTTDKTKLGDLRGEALRLELEEQDLRAWLTTAHRDLAEVERQEAIAADVELARWRLKAAENVRRGGAALDSGFSAERFANWIMLIEAMTATRLSVDASAPPPTGAQLRVFAVLAIKTMLQGVPLIAREFEAVAPSSRTTFAKISDGWATSAERSARAYLEGAGVNLEAAE
jgi:hypothetical protein